MGEPVRTELSVQAERALLVVVLLPGGSADPADPLGELRRLARTAGANIVDEMLAKRRSVHPGLYVGSGKASQIAERVEQNKADVVIFDNELSPAQIRELEQIVRCKVLDRGELILDIFAAHARTSESRLQVELAQLEYSYPRLTNMWTHLERIVGGAASAAGGIGARGPGEKQLETDRRLVQRRKAHLKRQIAAVDRRKVRQVLSRKDAFCVCLVGYTNGGKSTLLNALTGADAYVADQLFATLATKTRRWRVAAGQTVLLSDTVGFIRDLPHHLVASFRATLEEAIHADLLLHVADASNKRVDHEIASANEVLEELGCAENRRLLVLNKIDRIVDPTVSVVLARKYPDGLLVSASTGKGTEELVAAVAARCCGGRVRVALRADCTNGKLMNYIDRYAKVQSRTYTDSTVEIQAVIPARRLEQLRGFGDDVEILSHGPT